MIDITTIGWLTIDDIVLTDGTCKLASRGGGALYSAVGAHMWNPHVGIHSVAGKPYYDETRRLIEARGIDGELAIYDSERVRKRSEMIVYAIDARRQHFPDETPHVYRPQADKGERYRWDEAARPKIKDYNLLDILI